MNVLWLYGFWVMFPDSVMSGTTGTHHASVASSPEGMHIFPQHSAHSLPESLRAGAEQLREVGLGVRMPGREGIVWVPVSTVFTRSQFSHTTPIEGTSTSRDSICVHFNNSGWHAFLCFSLDVALPELAAWEDSGHQLRWT